MAGKTVTPEDLRHEFESRVRGIGRIVSLLSPWDAPLNLTRIWSAPRPWKCTRSARLIGTGCFGAGACSSSGLR